MDPCCFNKPIRASCEPLDPCRFPCFPNPCSPCEPSYSSCSPCAPSCGPCVSPCSPSPCSPCAPFCGPCINPCSPNPCGPCGPPSCAVQSCPKMMKCSFLPPCDFFNESCNPRSTNIFESPMCNVKLVENGACFSKPLFCSKGGK